jgi:hypothetical protein
MVTITSQKRVTTRQQLQVGNERLHANNYKSGTSDCTPRLTARDGATSRRQSPLGEERLNADSYMPKKE